MKMPNDDKKSLEFTMKENVIKIERWSLEFMTSHYEHALFEFTDYLDSLEEDPDHSNVLLMQFLVEFVCNIKNILQKRFQTSWEDFLIRQEVIDLFDCCTRSAKDMKNWIVCLSDHLDPYRTRTDSSPNAAVEDVKIYINKNLRNNFSRAELAELVHIHPDHLSHIFRSQTGISLRDYVAKERISQAKYLLQHTDLNISAVALECGYENAAYFSKMFKKAAGVTPKEFKNSFLSVPPKQPA